MRISDWSSDVCSSDLTLERKNSPSTSSGRTGMSDADLRHAALAGVERGQRACFPLSQPSPLKGRGLFTDPTPSGSSTPARSRRATGRRSENRRVGKKLVSKGSSRWAPHPEKKKEH